MFKQKGVFSIELAFVLLGMCAFLFFIFDLGYQVIQKSQLHRASYALSSVLKERKAFFTPGIRSTNWDISQDEADKIYKMAKKLLNEKEDNLRISIGFKSGKKSEQVFLSGSSAFQCEAKKIGDDITEGSKHDLNVYRVTVCRKVPAFFEKAISGETKKDSRVLQSTSLFVGR